MGKIFLIYDAHIFIAKSLSFSLVFFCRVTVKDVFLNVIPNLPGLVYVSFYDTKPVNLSLFVVTTLNEFIKYAKCMTANHI